MKPICLDIINETLVPKLTRPLPDFCERECNVRQLQSGIGKMRKAEVLKEGI
jgi:hypothetical protein